MNVPSDFGRVLNGKRYSVKNAVLVASDLFWDGNNMERRGRNAFLYRTPSGAYFVVRLTQWQGERDTLEPVTQDEAIELYERQLPEHELEYGDAFPGVTVADA